jgi:glycosyltransferase involved in cell wall biosynthesis
MHRDWDTIVEAVRNWPESELRIASKKINKCSTWPDNILIRRPETSGELRDLYDWADVMVVALKHNLHASGITVIAEAVLWGLPVISTDTGGLRAYFSQDEIEYVPANNSWAIRNKIEEIAGDDHLRLKFSIRAQDRISRDELTSYGYALRHRTLSESLFQ